LNDREDLLAASDDEGEVFLPDDSFAPTTKPVRIPWDDEARPQGESTYPDAEHGPDPVPEWVITSGFARDTELGVLKSGKEADVFLVERRLDDAVNLLAAKRYVPVARRSFRNQGLYVQGRRMRDRREQRAADRKTAFGSKVGASGWAAHEMGALTALWQAGIRVPYPVQRMGTELMMELIGDESSAAPRLVETHPDRTAADALFTQAVDMLRGLARLGLAHGDLSPYNLLVWEGELVMIDLPQTADLAINPGALDLFQRDVVNVCRWFTRKGVDTDPEALFHDCLRELF
jgi:RIO kinase 1